MRIWLKILEGKGCVTRKRSTADESSIRVCFADSGETLKEKAVTIPEEVAGCVGVSAEEGIHLYKILYKILGSKDEK